MESRWLFESYLVGLVGKGGLGSGTLFGDCPPLDVVAYHQHFKFGNTKGWDLE